MLLQAPYPYSMEFFKWVFHALDYVFVPLGFGGLTETEIEIHANNVMYWFQFHLLPFQGAITYAAFTGTPVV